MRKLLFLIVLAFAAIGGWYFASPWLAMKGLVDAAQAGDTAALEQRIDFPQLRANLHGDLRRGRDNDTGLLGKIGGAISSNIGAAAVDTMVNPRGMATLVATGGFAIGVLPKSLRGQDLSWDVERQGLDHFRGESTYEDGTAGPVLLFTRDGIGWSLTGLKLTSKS